MWARNAVRVKLYNKLNNYIEEHSLFDVLLYISNQAPETQFLELTDDEKCQVNILGTYYIAYDIYIFLCKHWKEVTKKDS